MDTYGDLGSALPAGWSSEGPAEPEPLLGDGFLAEAELLVYGAAALLVVGIGAAVIKRLSKG